MSLLGILWNSPNANLLNTNLPNANLPNANLLNANLPNANLPNANLLNYLYQEAYGFTCEHGRLGNACLPAKAVGIFKIYGLANKQVIGKK